MLSRKIFIGLLFLCAVVLSAFYIFLYSPQQREKMKIESELQETSDKFSKANLALNELQHTQKVLKEKKAEINEINARFIEREQLRKITLKIRNFTQDYNLRLIDFTPLFNLYFADTSAAPIKALPFSVIVRGKFLEIGRYLENWERREFFMIPDEIKVRKYNTRTDVLEATITGRLYAWVNDQE